MGATLLSRGVKGCVYWPWRVQTSADRCTYSWPVIPDQSFCIVWLPHQTFPDRHTHQPGRPVGRFHHGDASPVVVESNIAVCEKQIIISHLKVKKSKSYKKKKSLFRPLKNISSLAYNLIYEKWCWAESQYLTNTRKISTTHGYMMCYLNIVQQFEESQVSDTDECLLSRVKVKTFHGFMGERLPVTIRHP